MFPLCVSCYPQAIRVNGILAAMSLSRYRPRKPEEAAWGGSVSHSAYGSTTPGCNHTLSRTSSHDCGIESHPSGGVAQLCEVLQRCLSHPYTLLPAVVRNAAYPPRRVYNRLYTSQRVFPAAAGSFPSSFCHQVSILANAG